MNTLATVTYQVPSIFSIPVAFALLIGIILGMLFMARRR